jgi:ribosomal protein S10
MILLAIKISSKNKNSLKNFIKFLIKLCKKKKLNLTLIHYFNKKNKYKKISILTSPNANKNAQEQFLFKTYSKKITVFTFKIEKFLLFLKKLKMFLFTDVKINLNFFFLKKFIKKIISKTFNPENFKTKILHFA